jgi:HlyD family secretion protein
MRQPIFNASCRKIGGIWFVKLGRVNILFCVSRPKSILEVQRMDCTTYRAAVNMNELQRALMVRVAELNAQLKVTQLAGRADEISAALSEVKAAREQLAQADWRLQQKSQKAPRAALVADTLYTAGEWVQAGMPVVSLLPAENIKLKFFVSEKQLGALKIGQDVNVTCDGCAAIIAKITYIAPQAEYTSPLIYSKENRATLVFMIEARASPGEALKLHPGQPVEVKL